MSLQQSIVGLSAPFVVDVTGGGLYNSGFDYNSAAVLKDALPYSFHRQGKPAIKILKATDNLPAEYYLSRKLIQGLWAGNLSMYDPTEEPADGLQTVARRDDYVHPDNLGKLPNPGDYGPDGYFGGFPEELRPDVDIVAAGNAAYQLLPDHKMRVSTDAGHNLCEWFFLNSLVEGYKRGAPRNVAFVHVPPSKTEEDLKTGVEVLQAYIGALVSEIEVKSEV